MCVLYFPSACHFELTSVRHGVYRHPSGTVMVDDQRSHFVAKNLQKLALPCMKFVVSRKWNVVQFPIGLLAFMKDVSP
jgi:hypothetical protein